MATLTVGSGQQFATISAAVAASHDGDVVQVQAGTYINDFATINTKITLQGVGGMVNVVNNGGWDLPGDKGIFITNTDVTIDHFEFSGALSSSGNGAGIRYQGGNLTLTNDYFHDNQNGLLANPSPTGTISIQNSEFANNGNPNGGAGTHDLYVGDIAKLTIDNSYFHDVWNEFNLIKSRAAETDITNSRIFDLKSNASYEVDISNGGVLKMENNIIQQSPDSRNPAIVEVGAEGLTHANNSIFLNNNTILDEKGGIALYNPQNVSGQMLNTKEFDPGFIEMVRGSGVTESGTTHLSTEPTLDTSSPWASSGSTAPPSPPPPPVAGSGVLTAPDGGGTLQGADTADTLTGGANGANHLYGGGGDDQIIGGNAGDTINGNAGNDTVQGGAGADVISGGKDQDLLNGGGGHDTINGNLGNDTIVAGAGDTVLRGGQGDDVINGGAGNDQIWGDRGNNTMTGGAGADTFHFYAGSGVSTVTDFNYAEGDRVRIDDGAHHTAVQAGADVVVDLTGGGEMILQHTQLSALPADWIV